MKNLQNLKGAQTLNKQEQQTINGGGHPCGKTGGMVLPNILTSTHCYAIGAVWYNGQCWACY